MGYYQNPKGTEEAFADGWLRTGDEVNLKFDADGNIFIVDRIKKKPNQLGIDQGQGLQVALSELEGYLLSNPDVADAVVISVLDEYSGELSRAYVTLKPAVADAVKDERVVRQVKAKLCETVAPFKATAKYKQLEGGIEFLDAIPKNPSGKILRRVSVREYSWQSDRQARAAMTTTLAPKSYRDEWLSPNHPIWPDFHRNYWGAASDGRVNLDEISRHPPLHRFLDIWPPVVLMLLGVSIDGIGNSESLLVRDEMLCFAQRFRDAYNLSGEAIEGVVLLGQSGIGKTALLVFFLVQCMSRGEPVLFTTRYGETYLFDEHGVVAVTASNFLVSKHLPPRLDGTRRLWSLADCPLAPEPSPLSVTLDVRPRVFFITSLSPEKSRYEPFENEPSVRTWWMSRWNDEELTALLQPQRFGTFDAAAVRTLRGGAGPVPRDVLRLLLHPWEYITCVKDDMGYSSLPSIIALVLGTEPFSNEDCDCITFVGRAPGPLPTGLDNDAYEVGFRTRATAEAVTDKLADLPAEWRSSLFTHGTLGPDFELSRFLFGILARQYVYAPFEFDVEADGDGEGAQAGTGTGSPHAALSVLHHAPAPLAAGRLGWYLRACRTDDADPSASARRTTVVVDKRRSITWRASSSSGSLGPHLNPSTVEGPQSTSISEPVPWGARDSVPVTLADIDSEELPLDAVTCYRPAYSRPVFDALFFQVIRCERKVVLWAVQIASHHGEEDEGEEKEKDMDGGGFAMVGRLLERARAALPGAAVEVKYVLVVPRDSASDAGPVSTFDIEWELGDGFWGNSGEVYVQYVDVCGVCRVEDVFGVPVPVPS
ncbi:transporter [Ganoderma sinense ZZ0214-1]|uniref:Transporter n=1 Tax=Ganoderma sinense ZZ0214-1 TaxID=1077348 RepID=A0A2G8S2A9_9APHY|nr:transporter [Ganoderma sinense ZZ0214-1]